MLLVAAVVVWVVAALAAFAFFRRRRHTDDELEEHARELFARHGRTVYRALLLEVRLREYLPLPEGRKTITPDELEHARKKYRSIPLGHLVNELRKRPGVEGLVKVLDERVQDRKRLAHHLLWDRAEDMMTREGRDALMRELTDMGERFLDANKMVRRMSMEWLKARGVSEADFERMSRVLRVHRGLPPDLPSHLR
jgi:hypothetical protein